MVVPPSLSALRYYPVKGFQGEALHECALEQQALLPGDRAWAFASGHAKTETYDAETWLPKKHFLQVMSFAELIGLRIKPDTQARRFSLYQHDQLVTEADWSDAGAIGALCAALQTLLEQAGATLPGTISLRHLSAGGFSDTRTPWITVGGMASLNDFARATGTAPDMDRFRLNLWLDTGTAFEELDWIGQRAQIGQAILRFTEPVGRCDAINSDPVSGARQDDLPGWMRAHYGHSDLGVFAEVEQAGQVALGDKLIWL